MKYALGLVAAAAGLASAGPLVQRTQGLTSRNPARRAGLKKSGSAVNHRIEKANKDANVQYSGNWAGAVSEGSGWTSVEGVVTVPQVSGQSGDAASAWVGIDGDSCQTAILQTGISFYADGSFDAWYEWIPDYSYSFDNFPISVGDSIKMSVDATSTMGGTATLENQTTGQKVSHTFTNPPSTLCEQDAEWIVEAFQSGGSQVTLADFGTVTFTDAYASGSSGQVSAGDGSTIINMSPDQGQTVLTDCSSSGSSVTCSYTGSGSS